MLSCRSMAWFVMSRSSASSTTTWSHSRSRCRLCSLSSSVVAAVRCFNYLSSRKDMDLLASSPMAAENITSMYLCLRNPLAFAPLEEYRTAMDQLLKLGEAIYIWNFSKDSPKDTVSLHLTSPIEAVLLFSFMKELNMRLYKPKETCVQKFVSYLFLLGRNLEMAI